MAEPSIEQQLTHALWEKDQAQVLNMRLRQDRKDVVELLNKIRDVIADNDHSTGTAYREIVRLLSGASDA